MAVPLKGAIRVKGLPLRRKKFKTFLFLFVDKVPTAIKLEGGGVRP